MVANTKTKPATKPADFDEKAKEKAEQRKDTPVQPVPQNDNQIVLEIQSNHSAWAQKQHDLADKEQVVKDLKGEITKLEARKLKLLNILSGIDKPEPVQQKLDGQVMDQSKIKKAEELRRAPHAETKEEPKADDKDKDKAAATASDKTAKPGEADKASSTGKAKNK